LEQVASKLFLIRQRAYQVKTFFITLHNFKNDKKLSPIKRVKEFLGDHKTNQKSLFHSTTQHSKSSGRKRRRKNQVHEGKLFQQVLVFLVVTLFSKQASAG